MKNKIIYILIFSFMFLGFRFANAGLIINEIMYDLEGSDSVDSKSREWVEIYNPDGGEVVVGSGWRFFDGSANRTINSQESFSIPAGAFVIFAGDRDTFLSDHSGFSDSVYDTGMPSLNNTGATLKILDENGAEVDSLEYSSAQGANGNGNSLQKTSDSWIEASPTPGAENETSGSGGNGGGGGGSSSGNNSSNDDEEEEKKEVIKNPNMKAKITASTLAFIGQPLGIKADILGYSNEKVVLGRLYWNFGDGTFYEQKNNFEKFSHTYYYPGEYQVLLEYYEGHFSIEPEATNKMIIKVVPTNVVISKIGDVNDFFIELTNESSNDIDISGWNLKGGVKNFFFPKNTVILAKKKLTLGSRITGFNIGDQYNLKLFSVTGELISDYNFKIQAESIKPIPRIFNNNIVNKTKEINTIKNQELEILGDINLEDEKLDFNSDLTASALFAEEESDSKLNNSQLFFWIFVFLLIFSGGMVYYIRQNKSVGKKGDDFEILDE